MRTQHSVLSMNTSQ